MITWYEQCGAYDTAKRRGFVNGRTTEDLFDDIGIEVGEARHAFRTGKTGELAGELADIVIATMTFAKVEGVDLGKAIARKMSYNRTRTDTCHNPSRYGRPIELFGGKE